MRLSERFSIDPNASWVADHNAEAAEVVAAYEADRPIRVPLLCDDGCHLHGLYADEVDLDYRDYYTDPDVMLTVQLEAARRRRELPIYDMQLGKAPDRWPVAVDLHPVITPGWVGCPLLYRKDAVIAHRSLALSKEECRALPMPDPLTGGILATHNALLAVLKARCDDGLRFLGRPVGPAQSGIWCYGFFALALDIRGADLMADMYEDPDFARELLLKIATWSGEMGRDPATRPGQDRSPYGYSDHGIDMLSPELYEEFIVPIIDEMNRRRGTKAYTSLHHCGRGTHLFGIMKRHFGLTHIDALTYPLVDIAEVRREVGYDVWISGCIGMEIVKLGPPERIRQTVKELMASGAKGDGRLSLWVGDLLRGTPLAHRVALYESVREFGRY